MTYYAVTKEELIDLLAVAVQMTVRETVAELRKSGFLRVNDTQAYKSIASQLYTFFSAISDGKDYDHKMTDALKSIRDDPYYLIIVLYYREKKTIEQIAEIFDCEISTITRNKKRLCLELYGFLQENE